MRTMQGTMSCQCKRATRTALAAVAIAASVAPFLPGVLAGVGDPREAAGVTDPEANDVEMQRQIHELRSDLGDEREQGIGRQMEVRGTVRVILGVAIGVAGLWFYARFQAIAAEARVGAVIVRCSVLAQ